MVENIDYNVGRIIEKVKNVGLERETIIIYLSDNGPNEYRWNGGMRGKKGSVDEGGVRTPFYIQWKNNIKEGFSIEQIASSIDVLPTLCGLIGIPVSTANPIDGTDLSRLLLGEPLALPNRLVYNHWNGNTSVRSQRFRLDAENRLYDIQNDRGQTQDVSNRYASVADSLISAKRRWENETVHVTKEKDDRPFTLGHENAVYTQLPARDGEAHGTVKRSNRWPNDSFFTHWKAVTDSITWPIEVLADGRFQVDLYYTCPEDDLGSIVELRFKTSKIAKQINEGHDPPLKGMKDDRVPRMESYVKDFKPMDLGVISLKKGKGVLTLKALEIPNDQVGDFRLLQFTKIE